jgi:hypothetical protein
MAKPIAAMPNDAQAPGKLRNIQDDPFAVGNRETVAELLLSYDPTPATWMYEWDNDFAEDAKFAMNLGFVFISQLPKMLQLDFLAIVLYSRFPTQHPHKICGK